MTDTAATIPTREFAATYASRVGRGIAAIESLDDEVDAWHADSANATIPLHEYLGFTLAEMRVLVKDQGLLPRLIAAANERAARADAYLAAMERGDLDAANKLIMLNLTAWPANLDAAVALTSMTKAQMGDRGIEVTLPRFNPRIGLFFSTKTAVCHRCKNRGQIFANANARICAACSTTPVCK